MFSASTRFAATVSELRIIFFEAMPINSDQPEAIAQQLEL